MVVASEYLWPPRVPDHVCGRASHSQKTCEGFSLRGRVASFLDYSHFLGVICELLQSLHWLQETSDTV